MMRSRKGVVLLAGVILAAGAVGYGLAPAQPADLSAPYTPTRAEWLAVECNSCWQDASPQWCFMRFAPARNALVLNVTYRPAATPADLLDELEEAARKVAAMTAEAHGWGEVPVQVKRNRLPK